MASTTAPIWKRNLRVLSVSVFFAGMGFSEIMPFLSLYIATLGHYSYQQLNFYSGIVFSVMYVVSAITSPYWGKLADQKGRKLMILRRVLRNGDRDRCHGGRTKCLGIDDLADAARGVRRFRFQL